jgi:outer membrane autotransporter protein
MFNQHKYRPQHLALAIALALGGAEFSYAQQLSAQAEPASAAEENGQPDAEPNALTRLLNFIESETTVSTVIDSPQPARRGISLRPEDRDDLIIVRNGGSFEGRVDGGKGTNVIQLDGPEGGELGNTRNFNGLYVSQGAWTLTSTGDFSEGVVVFNDGSLTNNGSIEGGAIALGKLFNNGDIKGDVIVEDGGTFAGPGRVGGLEVSGQLHVDRLHGAPTVRGDLSFAKAGVLSYEVTPDGRGETIKVDGTARLNDATLNIIAASGDFPQSSPYTIIEAKNVEGEFGKVLNDLAFMTPILDYSDKTRVGLTYTRNEVPIESAATTENGQAFARNLEEPKAAQPPQQPSNSANAAVTALLASNKQTAALALEQLAGSSNANLAKATLSSVDPVSNSMLSAMRQLDSTHGSGNLRERNNSPRLAAGNEDNGRVWLQALGHGGKLDRDMDPLQHSTKGLLLGADWSLDEEWRLGLMGGKSRTRLDSKDLDGNLDSWHLGAYALRQNGPMSLRLGATYSGHDGSTARRVAFTGFSDRPKGSYDASTQQAFAEVGYNLGRANVSIEPFASLGYQRYQRDGYTEKGGAASLKVHEQAQSNLHSTVGLRLAKVETLDNGMRLTPRFSAGWKHTYGEIDTSTRQRLVTGGSNYTAYGVELDRNSLLVDAGLDLGLSKHHSVGVGVTGEMGSDSRNHGVMGQWRMAF